MADDKHSLFPSLCALKEKTVYSFKNSIKSRLKNVCSQRQKNYVLSDFNF